MCQKANSVNAQKKQKQQIENVYRFISHVHVLLLSACDNNKAKRLMPLRFGDNDGDRMLGKSKGSKKFIWTASLGKILATDNQRKQSLTVMCKKHGKFVDHLLRNFLVHSLLLWFSVLVINRASAHDFLMSFSALQNLFRCFLLYTFNVYGMPISFELIKLSFLLIRKC